MKTCLMGHLLKNQCKPQDINSSGCCLIRVEVYSIFIQCRKKCILGVRELRALFVFWASPKEAINGLAPAARHLLKYLVILRVKPDLYLLPIQII